MKALGGGCGRVQVLGGEVAGRVASEGSRDHGPGA